MKIKKIVVEYVDDEYVDDSPTFLESVEDFFNSIFDAIFGQYMPPEFWD